MAKKEMIGQSKIDFWQRHIRRWKQSRISQTNYCEENDIKKSTFSYWLRKITNKYQNSSFVEIAIPPYVNEHIEIIFKEEFKIIIKDNFNDELLIKIIKTLGKTI